MRCAGSAASSCSAQPHRLVSPKSVTDLIDYLYEQVDDLCRLRRFLVLGAEGGSYYQSQAELALGNAQVECKLPII